ncbi:MAG: hypothetical protein Q8M07_14140, partial [Prosthecobacter sp.]|nr:hypothetical protein [Prosthecobacter sp.]
MFDTIRLDPPLKCPVCSADVAEVQTHDFGETLSVYRIGSVVTMSPMLTGIMKETLYCAACCKEDASRERVPVYIGIWHSILVTAGFQLSEVESRLAAVDRLDLIGWLEQAQREARDWERRFHGLRNDVHLYREHLQTPPEATMTEKDARRAALRRVWGLPDDVLNSP